MEDRIALVIGNANYSNITRLKNPIQDATAIAASLGGLGFRLVEGRALLDANRLQIEQSIQQFVKELGRRAVGLFYFAGHGLQLGGANYVVPITAGATRETHIEADLVDVGRLLAGMEQAQTALNVLILDACRSDPFEGRSYRSTQGLAPMQARSGTIISYATQPGNVAFDGVGNNSPFVQALLEVLQQRDLDVFQLFNEVGIRVRQRTGGKQVPWVTNSPVEGRFIFNRGGVGAGAANGRAAPPAPPPGGEWWSAAALPQGGAAPAAIRVSPTEPGSDRTIQEAVDAAPENVIVRIAPGE